MGEEKTAWYTLFKLFRKISVKYSGSRKAKYADQKSQVVYEGVRVYMYGAVL